MTTVAVVTPVHGRHDHLAAQRRSLAAGTRRPDLVVHVAMDDTLPPTLPSTLPPGAGEEIVVDVPVPSLGLPLAAARNAGVARALSWGVDVVVVLDVDVLAGRTLVAGYEAAVTARPEVLWSGPVTYLPPPPPTGYPVEGLDRLDAPHAARPAPAAGEVELGGDPDLFWSLSFAVSAATWRRHGGFDEAYVGYGGEDTDYAQRMTARGVGLGWAGSARGYHQHHPVHDPPVGHLDDILRNGRLFHDRWGRWPMTGWLRAFAELGLVAETPHGWERTC